MPKLPAIVSGNPAELRRWRIRSGLPAAPDDSALTAPPDQSEGVVGGVVGPARPSGVASVAPYVEDPCLFADHEIPECVGRPETKAVHDHAELRRNALFAIVIFIFGIFMMLESCHNQMIKVLSRWGEPYVIEMVHALLKEISIMGLISFLSSIVTRMKWMEQVNIFVFGVPPPSVAPMEAPAGGMGSVRDMRGGHCLSELSVVLEDIHMLVFCIMVGLIVSASVSMIHIVRISHGWAKVELILQRTSGQMGMTLQRILEDQDSKWKCWTWRGKLNQLQYFVFRSEFLHPCRTERPHGVHVETFSFYQYMKDCCGEAVVDQTKIPAWCYIMILLFLVILRPMTSFSPETAVYLHTAAFGAIFLCLVVVTWKLSWIECQLSPAAKQIVRKDKEISRSTTTLEDLEKLKPYRKRPHVTYKSFIQLREWFCGTTSPSQHEQLFWFHRNGPGFLKSVLRLVSLFTAGLVGLCVDHVINFPFTWRSHWWVFMVLAPVVILIHFMYQSALVNTVMFSVTEGMPQNDVIHSINRREHEKRNYRHHKLLARLKIKAVQRSILEDVRRSPPGAFWTQEYEKLPEATRRKVDSTWRSYTDGKGKLDRGEIVNVLNSIGLDHAHKTLGIRTWLDCLSNGADDVGEESPSPGKRRFNFSSAIATLETSPSVPFSMNPASTNDVERDAIILGLLQNIDADKNRLLDWNSGEIKRFGQAVLAAFGHGNATLDSTSWYNVYVEFDVDFNACLDQQEAFNFARHLLNWVERQPSRGSGKLAPSGDDLILSLFRDVDTDKSGDLDWNTGEVQRFGQAVLSAFGHGNAVLDSASWYSLYAEYDVDFNSRLDQSEGLNFARHVLRWVERQPAGGLIPLDHSDTGALAAPGVDASGLGLGELAAPLVVSDMDEDDLDFLRLFRDVDVCQRGQLDWNSGEIQRFGQAVLTAFGHQAGELDSASWYNLYVEFDADMSASLDQQESLNFARHVLRWVELQQPSRGREARLSSTSPSPMGRWSASPEFSREFTSDSQLPVADTPLMPEHPFTRAIGLDQFKLILAGIDHSLNHPIIEGDTVKVLRIILRQLSRDKPGGPRAKFDIELAQALLERCECGDEVPIAGTPPTAHGASLLHTAYNRTQPAGLQMEDGWEATPEVLGYLLGQMDRDILTLEEDEGRVKSGRSSGR